MIRSALCRPNYIIVALLTLQDALTRWYFAKRHNRRNRRAVACRADLQAATELPEALTHPDDAHAQLGSASGAILSGPVLSDRGWHPLPPVLNAQPHRVPALVQPNARALAARMEMHIRERLLDDAVERGLYLCGQ